MIKKISFVLLVLNLSIAQHNSSQIEGLRSNNINIVALKNLTIFQTPKKKLQNGIIIIRDGIIEKVGEKIEIPNDAFIIDCGGKTAYAGFIDLYTNYGMPKNKKTTEHEFESQNKSSEARGTNSWNQNIKTYFTASENFLFEKESAEKFRANGFTSVVTFNNSGIFRGTSALVQLNDGTTNNLILKENISQQVAFESERGESYPNSLTGAIALIRQTLFDADWYLKSKKIYELNPNQLRLEKNKSLDVLSSFVTEKKIFVFETSDELNLLRASKITKEFNLNSIYRGSGFEYRRLDAIKNLNPNLILPINFPDAPKVENPHEAMNVEYSDLQHWDNAPENPARLKNAGINFSLTTSTMKDVSKFLSNLRLTVKKGLKEEDALSSLTIIPSKFIGAEELIGTIENGKIANIILTDGNIFSEKTKIIEVWIGGEKHVITKENKIDLRGDWQFSLKNKIKIDSGKIEITGEKESFNVNLKIGSIDIKTKNAKLDGGKFTFSFLGDSIGIKGIARIISDVDGENISGKGENETGEEIYFNAKRISEFKEKMDSTKKAETEFASYDVLFPESPYGLKNTPTQIENLLLKNGTVWTSASSGILKETDILISKGKIIQIGKNISAPKNSEIIDCNGKHITAGLIDAHSHTAISNGINESGQAITAEVRMGDVINSDDINIYRELAGGLTAANILHGSANSIGGQNQVIKLRWGALPEEFKFEGSIPGIKFALGENPKQANWGDRFTTRYPQTRMGVEQQIRDEFIAAKDYELSLKNYNQNSNLIPPRKDLELDAIVEILNKKRIVHAHSYRQDEILMLARVAKNFNFKIGTFQHVLEGYKVAEAIKEIGAGASCFTDWWAYKYEVIDAIPYAGALMHNAGVLVSFNSDSNELARRMNLEAAKAIKYGGISEEEAIKFVTINPAKQLMIDNKVGSIEIGKDADFVIWSQSPLSTSTKCLQTWIDGRKYFDVEIDKINSDEMILKRAKLIQKILNSPNKNSGGASKQGARSFKYSCSIDEEGIN